MSSSSIQQQQTYTRAYASFIPTNQRFKLPHQTLSSGLPTTTQQSNDKSHPHPYSRQYSHLYTRRLNQFKPSCLNELLKRKKDNVDVGVIVDRIIELKEGELSTIIGTFVKDRPLLLKEGEDIVPSDDIPSISTITVDPPLSQDDDTTTTTTVVMEDESGRVELNLSSCTSRTTQFDNEDVTTGIVAAVTGIIPLDSNTGVMNVDSVTFPSLPPNPRPPTISTNNPNSPLSDRGDEVKKAEEEEEGGGGHGLMPYFRNALDGNGIPLKGQSPVVVLVSGLNAGGGSSGSGGGITTEEEGHSLRTDMLIDYITGNLGNGDDGAAAATRVARVIFAGGNVGKSCTSPFLKPSDYTTTSTYNNNNNQKHHETKSRESERAVFPLREYDMIISNLVRNQIPVDIIPGINDPTNATIPQQPFHYCLLPHSCGNGTNGGLTGGGGGGRGSRELVYRSTNPYEAYVGDKQFLGTDGRNINELRRFLGKRKKKRRCGGDDKNKEEETTTTTIIEALTPLEIMERTIIQYKHLCPSSPESLPSFPSNEYDPLVLQRSTPHVYFCGNCPTFDTKIIRGNKNGGSGSGSGGVECRLVCIPDFEKTGDVVLLDLITLDVDVVHFDDNFCAAPLLDADGEDEEGGATTPMETD